MTWTAYCLLFTAYVLPPVHNNFYFLRQLSEALRPVLQGTVISECFSQEKDELILRFETHGKPFYLKASLASGLSALSFPEDFQRARKNSVDLFSGLIGHRVTAIRQFENERSFALILEEGKSLLFKMHGNRSNLILFEGERPVTFFRNNIPADEDLIFSSLDRMIDWSVEALSRESDHTKLYYTFGKLVWRFLEASGYGKATSEEKYERIQFVRRLLENPESYYLISLNGRLHLSLIRMEPVVATIGDPITAANDFYYKYTHDLAFTQQRSHLISILNARLQSSERYYQKNFDKLAEIERDTNYKTWADLLMANLHIISPGTEVIHLPDFYHPGTIITIKLKKELNAQRNAAVFYKKAKNQHIEIERLQESLEHKEKEIQKIKDDLAALQTINDLKTIRRKAEELGLTKTNDAQEQSLPYHEFIVNGFRIWVGRSAKQNDELTLKFAYKEDLWLHAKDVAGSHVIIKHQSGKNFPKDVIERAAELAAYNSKRKTETLCPVVFTPKKYVRKRKGDPAGAVVVEREDVIMVVPRL
jgi:predicted ribosome quality control (RQC) complex YloA/Tae2 family protein